MSLLSGMNYYDCQAVGWYLPVQFLVTMWVIGMQLSSIGMQWLEFDEWFGPKRHFMRRRPPTKPPDKANKYFAALDELIQRERALSSPPTLMDRLLRRKPQGSRRRVLLQALAAAQKIETQMPSIDLIGQQSICKDLRKYKRGGQIMTAKVSEEDRARLLQVLEDLPTSCLGAQHQGFNLVVDTGCSKTSTAFIEDFVPGTLQKLAQPLRMTGIAGGLLVDQEGTVRYEVIDDESDLQVIETTAFYLPALKCRLFSPQAYLAKLSKNGSDPEAEGELVVKSAKSVLKWANGKTLSIHYDDRTHLPQVRAYKNAVASASELALKGNVDDETNQNLTNAQKTLLRWHFRLGHIGFAAVQWLGRQGFLGVHGEKMAAANLQAPKCAACQFGKQGKTPTPSKHGNNDAPGGLLKEKLVPGQLIFMDQYQSKLPGRAFTSKGKGSSALKFEGGTLFYDAASSYIFCNHQVGLTAYETLESKMKFEREAMTSGVQVQAYHTDNGVFTSKEFMKELAEKGQGLTLSGVSAQFQNGAAENGIKIVVRYARTMMLHAALRWPGFAERDLWPMALSHAVHLYNQTPRQESGLAPIELFTSTKSEHKYLLNSHPWGCPVYVLEPRLRDGLKVPKWDPRSKRGQYMGALPMHASTVGLVWNLQTGTITPQFHMVFDDFFETVHSDEQEIPIASSSAFAQLLRARRIVFRCIDAVAKGGDCFPSKKPTSVEKTTSAIKKDATTTAPNSLLAL